MDQIRSNGNRQGRKRPGPERVSRREFIQTLGATAAAGSLAGVVEAGTAEAEGPDVIGPGPTPITLRVNGKAMRLEIEPSTTLLDALRMKLDLTGSKEVCDRGACGACSVMIDGELVASCMMLAVDAVGSEVTTVEGLADGDRLDPIQESFLRHDALQCGYCTPGLIMASKVLLQQNPKPSLAQVRRALSGNLCRCGTYTNVFNAVLDASGQPPVVDGHDHGKGA